jgi:hypothetical protein
MKNVIAKIINVKKIQLENILEEERETPIILNNENEEPENQEPENQEPENQEPENEEPENEEPENEEPENEEPENEEPELTQDPNKLRKKIDYIE